MNSRDKGKRGERQWRDELRAQGYHARRGQQFSGSPDSPDVVCEELKGFHFEVKAVQRLNIYDAMAQAVRDCEKESGKQKAESRKGHGPLTPALSPDGGEGEEPRSRKVPIVAHRRNRGRWLVTMEAETFFALVRACQPRMNADGHEFEGAASAHDEGQLTLGFSCDGAERETRRNQTETIWDAVEARAGLASVPMSVTTNNNPVRNHEDQSQ